MTSKEALEYFREFFRHQSPYELTKDKFDIIEKDLEVLEKLKSILKVSNYDDYISFYTDGYRNDKDVLEIKEWLEND